MGGWVQGKNIMADVMEEERCGVHGRQETEHRVSQRE